MSRAQVTPSANTDVLVGQGSTIVTVLSENIHQTLIMLGSIQSALAPHPYAKKLYGE